MLAARGTWRLFTDFDQSTPIKEIEKLWPFTQDHAIVIGSREAPGAIRAKEPFYRHLMGKGFNTLVQLLVIPGVLDTQCGFKLLRGDVTEHIFTRLSVYGRHASSKQAFTGAFDVEVLFLARKARQRVCEVPVSWSHFSTNRVHPIRDSLLMLRDVLRIRFADLLGKYAHVHPTQT
jgi:hypothetical protein